MNLTISRREWLRGDNQDSMLFRPEDGLRCCVGIYLKALGVGDDDMDHQGEATELSCELPNDAVWLITRDHAMPLYMTNDNPELSQSERERLIAQHFAKHDVIVTFTD